MKGIRVIGTGDFTHPGWFGELREKLEPAGNGLFSIKKEFQPDDIPDSCRAEVFFMLSAEISCIYSKNGKTRKVHSLVFAPDLGAAERINVVLSKTGNLSSDGRPILGLDAKKLLRIVMEASSANMLVPAHAWTPHFSVFGSVSGFDSLEECYEELAPHICAIETGLSSDPAMNWRLSALDRITLISNSDAHSLPKIGREANIFDAATSYEAIMDALKTGKGFEGTLEFFPEHGKYHKDGHRACGVSLSPAETIRNNYLCPACGKKVTVGVLHRVEKLADREGGFRPANAPRFYSLIPLPEIIAETLGVGVNSKAVLREYLMLLSKLGNEFKILMDTGLKDIAACSPELASAVSKVRSGDLDIEAGFDGEYGRIKIFKETGRKKIERKSGRV